MARIPVDPFNNDMDDLFNQLMGGMNGFNSDNRRYLINGREVTPEEYAVLPTPASPTNTGLFLVRRDRISAVS